MSKKFTIECIKEKLSEINSGIVILDSEYINCKVKMNCFCKVCNTPFLATWDSLSSKHFCPKCSNDKKANNKRFTLEEVVLQVTRLNRNILIIDDVYKNSRTGIKCKCIVCGNIWFPTLETIKRGRGCPVCARKLIASKQSYDIDIVKEKTKLINPCIEILSNDYFNAMTPLKCSCNTCGMMWTSNWNRIQSEKGCPSCAITKNSGNTHYFWKGGISALESYLRASIRPWRKQSIKACGGICDITKTSNNIYVHHLYSFNLILDELISKYKIELKENVSDYTNETLSLLKEKCLELHYKYGLGICLSEDVHKEFHQIYGYGNNTPKQYYEFKQIKTQNIKT